MLELMAGVVLQLDSVHVLCRCVQSDSATHASYQEIARNLIKLSAYKSFILYKHQYICDLYKQVGISTSSSKDAEFGPFSRS